ncbi:uncharacterized protein V6R79_002818 [Siganus canaliculatus]
MDWALVVILQVMFQPALSVWLTVEAEQSGYNSEFGEDVVMGCKFRPKPSNPNDPLRVTWHWISGTAREVYQMDNGVESLSTQDPDYRGRVKLLTEGLKDGLVRLQVSRLRINDSGTYQCLVNSGEGTDYKKISLSVTAPYKVVTKHIEKVAERDEVLLTCQSEGYPKASVLWRDGHQQQINSNTTSVLTPDQLYQLTSHIRVRSFEKNNYTCNFTSDGHSATFHMPDEMPVLHVKNDAVIIVSSIGVIAIVVIAAVFAYHRRKGSSATSTSNLLPGGRYRSVSTAACLPESQLDEEKVTTCPDAGVEENLGVHVKAHYADFLFGSDARLNSDVFDTEDLCQRLKHNDGQHVNLQDLLPAPGETLFLEGLPGSGKTTVAQILVSVWTKENAFSNILDLSAIQLLLYVDCGGVQGDLFQEIMTQLSLKDKMSTADDLRSVLTGSNSVLLLLDGYREGEQLFDESLKRFLSDRGGCRVVITACPGHCSSLKDTCGTGKLVELQTRTVKY